MVQTTVLTAAMMLALQTSSAVKAPKDFALRLEFGCSYPDVINMQAGTYEVPTSRGRAVTRVRISSRLKDDLFQLLTEQRFFELDPAVRRGSICSHPTSYTLWVTTNGRQHTVSWSECGEPFTDELRRLKAISDGITQPFQKMGAVKQLLALPRFYC